MIDVDPLDRSIPSNISEPYNVMFNCTIHPDSTADQCVVLLARDDGNVIATGM